MDNLLEKAVSSVQQAEVAFCKFITSNDVGETGSHQSGYHLHKNAWPLFFAEEGEKGTNKDLYVTIRWQDDFETSSRFIYYGKGTRNEYRLTRFGRNFPFLSDECIGDLLILCRKSQYFFEAYVLETDEEIEDFFLAINISATDANKIIPKQSEQEVEEMLNVCFSNFINSLVVEFPSTEELSNNARLCYNNAFGVTDRMVVKAPDQILLGWLGAEFQLFKALENFRYSNRIKIPFSSVEELVGVANTILNRRKSRAGRSLEHHLSVVFETFKLKFATQAIIEGNKRPDFIFPGVEEYQNSFFDENKLIVLGAKTTCKDRWRQILNEADRVKYKYLFTLQQGISKNQMDEMDKYGVRLVVPESSISTFPAEARKRMQLYSLREFIFHVVEAQG